MKPLEAIEGEIARHKKEIDRLNECIKYLEMRREKLLNLPEKCPSCEGTGQERYTDAAGSGDWRECWTCRGLGKIGPLKCRGCGRIIGTDMIYIRRKSEFPKCPWCGGALEHAD